MPTRNRGKEGKDDLLFGNKSNQEKICEAVLDLSFLLEKKYAIKSASQLVGNRYKLNTRQQNAVKGMSSSKTYLKIRRNKQVNAQDLKGKKIQIDGFNLLILMESLLSGAYVFKGLDGCYRDLSSVHGSYKSVTQTEIVLKMIGEACVDLKLLNVLWVFDKPVSNSGRLKVLLYEMAEKFNFPWDIILHNNPDQYLVNNKSIIVSSLNFGRTKEKETKLMAWLVRNHPNNRDIKYPFFLINTEL